MPSEDYTVVTPGGLKLKGVNGSKISKSHRKRRKPNPEAPSKDPQEDGVDSDGVIAKHNSSIIIAENQTAVTKAEEQHSEKETSNEPSGKTEAELRHEERRRRRVRLQPFPSRSSQKKVADIREL